MPHLVGDSAAFVVWEEVTFGKGAIIHNNTVVAEVVAWGTGVSGPAQSSIQLGGSVDVEVSVTTSSQGSLQLPFGIGIHSCLVPGVVNLALSACQLKGHLGIAVGVVLIQHVHLLGNYGIVQK